MLSTIAKIPLIPFVMNSDDLIFLFFIFARVSGLFVVSPLLTDKSISAIVRILLSVFITLLLAIALYPAYRGESPSFFLKPIPAGGTFAALQLAIVFFTEFAIGYLIGFCFALIFEGLMMAGQLTGIMIGFSITEIIDPITNSSQSLVSQLFVTLGALLMVCMDFHHFFFRILGESFSTIPLGNYHMPDELLQVLIQGSSRLFVYGLKFAAVPYIIMFLITIGLGFMAKVMPEMNVFMVGFSLKIFIGYYSLILAVGYFPVLLHQAFLEYQNLARWVIYSIGAG